MKKERIIHKTKHDYERLVRSVKMVIFAVITGVLLGFICTFFHYGIDLVTEIRLKHWWLVFLLPIGAVLITLFYRALDVKKARGTNLVLSAIHSGDEIPLRMAPLIFLSTIFSHLCGASVGREGAALQLGGSVSNALGKLFKFEDNDKHVVIMCGMSAAFSALFGTPMAAAIFSMEVVSVGIMHYAALVPCVISAFIARGIAAHFGVAAPFYTIVDMPSFGIKSALLISILAILIGVIAMGFCIIINKGELLIGRKITNPYLNAFIFGTAILALTLLWGNQDYNGTGIAMIGQFIQGSCDPWDFAMKIIFTGLSLYAGYKGGEIIPTFYIGAAFGCLFGNIVGLSPSLCAAVGIGALFCGVTNSPITSILICLELFGMKGMPFFLLATALSYMVSGYYGIYKSQKIVYSKYKSNFINKNTH